MTAKGEEILIFVAAEDAADSLSTDIFSDEERLSALGAIKASRKALVEDALRLEIQRRHAELADRRAPLAQEISEIDSEISELMSFGEEVQTREHSRQNIISIYNEIFDMKRRGFFAKVEPFNLYFSIENRAHLPKPNLKGWVVQNKEELTARFGEIIANMAVHAAEDFDAFVNIDYDTGEISPWAGPRFEGSGGSLVIGTPEMLKIDGGKPLETCENLNRIQRIGVKRVIALVAIADLQKDLIDIDE